MHVLNRTEPKDGPTVAVPVPVPPVPQDYDNGSIVAVIGCMYTSSCQSQTEYFSNSSSIAGSTIMVRKVEEPLEIIVSLRG